jgi:hypothetical protein
LIRKGKAYSEWEKKRSLPKRKLHRQGEEAYLRKRKYKKQSAKVTTSGSFEKAPNDFIPEGNETGFHSHLGLNHCI